MKEQILVVEDEVHMAILMKMVLQAAGMHVYDTVGSVAAAMDVIERSPPTAAILDINVEDGTIYPVATILRQRSIPFGFCTSMSHDEIPAAFRDVPFVRKPLDAEDLVDFAEDILDSEFEMSD